MIKDETIRVYHFMNKYLFMTWSTYCMMNTEQTSKNIFTWSRGFRTLFELEENYHGPVRINNALSNNYIECKSNDDKNRALTMEEYFNENRP